MVLEQANGASALAVMEEAPACLHHWVIEPANGRYSRGVCRKCHEAKAFENSIYEGPDPEGNE